METDIGVRGNNPTRRRALDRSSNRLLPLPHPSTNYGDGQTGGYSDGYAHSKGLQSVVLCCLRLE